MSKLFLLLIYSMNISFIGAVVPDFYWRDYVPGNIPCDAYEAAPSIYLGQLFFKGNHLPATIYPENNTAISEFGGKRISQNYVRIFCTPDSSRFYWKLVDFDKPYESQLDGAVKGGYELSVSGNSLMSLFVGKKINEEEWKISKVISFEYSEDKGLWLWNKDQKAVNFRQFYILKYNTTDSCNRQCHANI